MLNVKILATKILAKEAEKKEKLSAAGLVIPTLVKDPNISAVVVLTGTGTDKVDMPVKEGETILFSPHAAQRVRIEDVDYLLVDIRDVLAFY